MNKPSLVCVVLSHEHRASLEDGDAHILARVCPTQSSEASDKHPNAYLDLCGNSYCCIGQVTSYLSANVPRQIETSTLEFPVRMLYPFCQRATSLYAAICRS